MDLVERLDLLAAGTIHCWAATYRRVWQRACEHDGIDPGEACVVLSEGNPFAPYVDTAFRQWREAVAQNRQVGYVGLVIQDGDAVIPDNIVREARRLKREWERAAKKQEKARRTQEAADPAAAAARQQRARIEELRREEERLTRHLEQIRGQQAEAQRVLETLRRNVTTSAREERDGHTAPVSDECGAAAGVPAAATGGAAGLAAAGGAAGAAPAA